MNLVLTGVWYPCQVELRVGIDAPARPVTEKKWLKDMGMLPMGGDVSSSGDPNFDSRAASAGGCDSPTHFEGCHIYYIKVHFSFC